MSKNKSKTTPTKKEKPVFLLGKTNFIILTVGLLTIFIGFFLMSGGATTDPNVYNEEIFSFRRIRLAPTVVLIGFGIVFYSVYYTKKKSK